MSANSAAEKKIAPLPIYCFIVPRIAPRKTASSSTGGKTAIAIIQSTASKILSVVKDALFIGFTIFIALSSLAYTMEVNIAANINANVADAVFMTGTFLTGVVRNDAMLFFAIRRYGTSNRRG